MPMELVTDEQLERYMSAYGIATFADHDDDGDADADVLPDCKTYANGFLVGKLSQRYPYASLASAVIMPEIAAVVTLRQLCTRRGNAPPASLEARYQEIVARDGLLDEIIKGLLPLVDSAGDRLAERGGFAPQHANIQIDRAYSEAKQRVIDGSSDPASSRLRRFNDRWSQETQ